MGGVEMAKDNRKEVEVKSEMRTKEISKMIGEGGLGAEDYYEIKKSPSSLHNKNGEEKPEKEE